MAVWTVWEHARFGDPAVKARFVRDAFSWWAALLGPLWALLQGMPLVFLVMGAVQMALMVAAYLTLGEPMGAWAYVLFSLWFGFEARAMRRWALKRRGWTMTAVVTAKRYPDAERRYFVGRDDIPPDTLPGPAASFTPPPAPGGHTPGSETGPWGAPVIGVMPEGVR